MARLRLLSYMVGGFPLSLFERIADVLDADLEVDRSRSGPAPGDDPFADGHADLGWICSTSFVDLAMRRGQPSISLAGVGWVPDDPEIAPDDPVYYGDVVTTDSSGISSLDDLAGRTIGCNDEISLSGHLALRFALVDAGRDPDNFADLRFTGGHRMSLAAVAAADLDAAVVDSVVLAGVGRDDDRAEGLRRIGRLGPWPTQPLVASTRLDDAHVAELSEALLASNDDPAMADELGAAALLRFVETGPEHYAPVRVAMDRLARSV